LFLIPVSALPVVVQTLKVSLEELFGQGKPAAAATRQTRTRVKGGAALARISALAKPRQRALTNVIEAVLG
jgi:hypothetical protein